MQKEKEQTLRVAIQGIAGCFHDAAARQYFDGKEVETIPFDSFPALFDALSNDASLLGIVAIENTIAGSLLANHELLRQSNHKIIGEHSVRISHVLCALPGETLDSIYEVNSHPMALMQCEQYLRRHPSMRMVEKFDTAGSAEEIARENLKGHAAVCGEFAANLYGLDILEKGIETNKRNFTRFLILADPLLASDMKPGEQELNKASIVFTLPHNHGALSKVLTILSFYDINLTKIQSLPVIGREWEYRFYADLTFASYFRYRQSLQAIRPLTNEFRILGEYVERVGIN
ncbi:MAG: prephenate dehydratase [Muribaculaceae bacterium]|nr:prephenate dehydratase [Muribaculaceae bacterium]MDE6755204.1 prephenate dehydratase [Muribaculaceae bacterium]